MKKHVFFIFTLSVLGLVSCKKKDTIETNEQVEITENANAEIYKVDTESSVVKWEGGKISGDKHYGTIHLSEGAIEVKEGVVVGGTFVMDMNTIDSEDLKDDAEMKAKLEGHLKGSNAENSDHFFNVEKYPYSKFVISEVNNVDGKQLIKGNLTIKDITKSIEFPAQVFVTANDVVIKSSEFAIDRTEFNVNYKSGKIYDNLGDKAINDDILIHVEVKGVK